jgi:AcrR family transcriptional regulator
MIRGEGKPYHLCMTSPTPALRADAVRNRALLLAAAEREFAEVGVDASVSAITQRAGVAKGTFFRHFRSKGELIAAVVSHRYGALTDLVPGLLDYEEPGIALRAFLAQAVDRLQKQDLVLLQATLEGDPMLVELQGKFRQCLIQLLTRAQEANAVRPDVTEADLLILLCAPVYAMHVSPNGARLRQMYFEVIVDGLGIQSRQEHPSQ